MTRDEMNALVWSSGSFRFQSEVDFLVNNVDREDDYDAVSAVIDIVDRQEEPDGDKKLLKEARKVLIALGFYRVMPQSEIDNTWVSAGTKWSFKMDGVAYTTDEYSYEWLDTRFVPKGE